MLSQTERRCHRCYNVLPEGAIYCPNCGSTVSDEEEEASYIPRRKNSAKRAKLFFWTAFCIGLSLAFYFIGIRRFHFGVFFFPIFFPIIGKQSRGEQLIGLLLVTIAIFALLFLMRSDGI